MSEPMLDGVLDVVDTEEPTLHKKTAPVKQTKTEKVETKTTETKTAEAPKSEPRQETKTEVESKENDEPTPDSQDFSRPSEDTSETKTEETTAPSKSSEENTAEETAPEEQNTETETKEAETTPDWKPNLPAPPQFNLPAPEINDEGYVTNMTPEQYQNYIVEKTKFEMRAEAYNERVETQALDAAEKILPEIKTNPAVRQMVENARVASILNGRQINSYEAAKTVKEALGISPTKLAEAKAEGAQNAKVSITTQKNAAVETTGSTKKKVDNTKNTQLTKRLKAGEESAFVELMDQWDKDGKLS